MMELKLLSKDKKSNKVSFMLKGAASAYANSLRRTIISMVPTMAIEDVEFKKNSSILYDEMIAHRLGLVPLSTDLKTYNLPEGCKCDGEGCARCTATLSLSAKGPEVVTASKLNSSDPKITPVYPEMPIVKLLKGQELAFEAKAVLGNGAEHAKWISGLVFYKCDPVINVDKSCDNCAICVKQCPKNIFEMKNNKLKIIKDRVRDCHLCGACAEECPKGSVKLSESDDTFIFTLESWGQLSCKEILTAAVDAFDQRLDAFADEVKALK